MKALDAENMIMMERVEAAQAGQEAEAHQEQGEGAVEQAEKQQSEVNPWDEHAYSGEWKLLYEHVRRKYGSKRQ
ncbi:MAG: hypothetical protein A2189_10050 [Paenibacillus sp. RIFOXYA1_FULL_44_5]|nr:MAG: hypothetical protein A2189_10050 [Paenibacillus sp. RIFOXYA1_FULL_44_5]